MTRRLTHFTEDDERSILVLANHLGIALDRHVMLTELAAAQRAIVHELQDAVLPPPPEVANVELGRYYVGAENAFSTGGDIYDWVVLPDGDLHIAIVDIMGKGVSATKDALTVTHALRLLALEGSPLADLVAKADPLVTAQNPDLVATLMVGRYSPATGKLRLIGAGHPPALIVRGTEVEELPAEGHRRWAGPGPGRSNVVETTLGRGDTLILYTDGLIESTRDIIKGLENLRAAAADTAGYPAASLARALVDRALAGAVRADDSLALVLRRRMPPDRPVAPDSGPVRVPVHAACRRDFAGQEPAARTGSSRCRWTRATPPTSCWWPPSCARTPCAMPGATGGSPCEPTPTAPTSSSASRMTGRARDPPAAEPPDADAEAGRGLFLAQTLTDELWTRSDGALTDRRVPQTECYLRGQRRLNRFLKLCGGTYPSKHPQPLRSITWAYSKRPKARSRKPSAT